MKEFFLFLGHFLTCTIGDVVVRVKKRVNEIPFSCSFCEVHFCSSNSR